MLQDQALKRQLIDLASRLEVQDKRIERLETLEHETTAFPSGGLVPICDVKLTMLSTFIDLCSFPIPQTFRHLAIIHSLGVNSPFVIDKFFMNFNGDFTPNYWYYVREEHPTTAPPIGSADTEAVSIAGTDSKFKIGKPAASDSFPASLQEFFNAGFILIPDYTQDSNRKSAAWWGAARFPGNFGEGFTPSFEVYQGGGYWNETPMVAITAIRLTAAGGLSFVPNSRATLYGL